MYRNDFFLNIACRSATPTPGFAYFIHKIGVYMHVYVYNIYDNNWNGLTEQDVISWELFQ